MGMVFVNRESKRPNRYKVTDDNGNSYYLTLERADEPVVQGTPLNAETFNELLSYISDEYVSVRGEQMDGELIAPKLVVQAGADDDFPSLFFYSWQGHPIGALGSSYLSHKTTYLSNLNPDTGTYEAYFLPEKGTENAAYHFLTTKHGVPIEHGGTGARNAADARANLGIGCALLHGEELSGNASPAVFQDPVGYSAYLVTGYPGNSSNMVTMLVPRLALSETETSFQLTDETSYTRFGMKIDATGVTISKTGSSGKITAIYGIL